MKVDKFNLKIAMFIPSLDGGGAERVFVQLANGLLLKTGNVDLLVSRSGGYYNQFVSNGVNLIDFNKQSTIASLLSLIKYINSEKPDVVFSTLTNANVVTLLAVLFTRYKPTVIIRETIEMTEYANRIRGIKVKVLNALTKVLYPKADGVIALSKGVATDLEKRFKGLKRSVKVIYNPGPSEQEFSIGGSPSELFLHSKARCLVFVAMGRLHDQKDYPTLIKAFEKIRKKVHSNLWIFGEGEERTILEQLVFDLGLENDVFMPGFVHNPYPYLKAADVFVMSSKYEGGPSSMLQAMACGCKIVSTDAPSGPAEFLQDGEQGRLVPVGDFEAFANAVLLSLNEPIDLSSRQKSMHRFDPKFIIDEYLNFLYLIHKNT